MGLKVFRGRLGGRGGLGRQAGRVVALEGGGMRHFPFTHIEDTLSVSSGRERTLSCRHPPCCYQLSHIHKPLRFPDALPATAHQATHPDHLSNRPTGLSTQDGHPVGSDRSPRLPRRWATIPITFLPPSYSNTVPSSFLQPSRRLHASHHRTARHHPASFEPLDTVLYDQQ
jgi:hypothetical protein